VRKLLEVAVQKHGSHNQASHGGKGGGRKGGGGGGLTGETVSQNKEAMANINATTDKVMDRMDDEEFDAEGAPIDEDMHAESGIQQTTSFYEDATAESLNEQNMGESYKADMENLKESATTFGQDAISAGEKIQDPQLIAWGKQIVSNAAKIKVGD